MSHCLQAKGGGCGWGGGWCVGGGRQLNFPCTSYCSWINMKPPWGDILGSRSNKEQNPRDRAHCFNSSRFNEHSVLQMKIGLLDYRKGNNVQVLMYKCSTSTIFSMMYQAVYYGNRDFLPGSGDVCVLASWKHCSHGNSVWAGRRKGASLLNVLWVFHVGYLIQ